MVTSVYYVYVHFYKKSALPSFQTLMHETNSIPFSFYNFYIFQKYHIYFDTNGYELKINIYLDFSQRIPAQVCYKSLLQPHV